MTDRPILFSAPMIRALLSGRKTQTRRLLKPQPPEAPASAWQAAPNNTSRHAAPYLDAYCGERSTPENPRGMSLNWHWWTVDDRPGPVVTKAICAPGDRLWVRETWRVRAGFDNLSPSRIATEEGCKSAIGVWYECDPPPPSYISLGRARSSIHMPRWASRLTLTVTDVRVQRLQDITYGDTRAEGIEATDIWKARQAACLDRNEGCGSVCRDSFAELWNSLHGPDAWAQNPWVSVTTFTVHHCNIDQMGDAG